MQALDRCFTDRQAPVTGGSAVSTVQPWKPVAGVFTEATMAGLPDRLKYIAISDNPRTYYFERRIRAGMIGRCHNKNHPRYDYYGGRGISVCERWRDSFEAFWNDMGPRPSNKHSIDRIDNDGDYEPSNCRWATKKEQCRNKRNNHIVTVDGVTLTVTDMAVRYGLHIQTVMHRFQRGLDVDSVFKIPGKKKVIV